MSLKRLNRSPWMPNWNGDSSMAGSISKLMIRTYCAWNTIGRLLESWSLIYVRSASRNCCRSSRLPPRRLCSKFILYLRCVGWNMSTQFAFEATRAEACARWDTLFLRYEEKASGAVSVGKLPILRLGRFCTFYAKLNSIAEALHE